MSLTATAAWLSLVSEFYTPDHVVAAPRGMETFEIPQHTISVDMRYPVVYVPGRKLSYKFMASEALWILNGRNDLAYLTAVNKNMAKYSDDGVTLSGAYGPHIMSQLKYVVDTLVKDQYTRQAVLTIWVRTPRPSKDIPCTLAMQFMIRDGRLNCHTYMRSSDAWLGVPYDIFTFSCVAEFVRLLFYDATGINLELDTLYNTAGSRHLYQSNADDVSNLDMTGFNELKFKLRASSGEELFDVLTIMRNRGL